MRSYSAGSSERTTEAQACAKANYGAKPWLVVLDIDPDSLGRLRARYRAQLASAGCSAQLQRLREGLARRSPRSAQSLATKQRKAAPDQCATLYRDLGVRLAYQHERGIISVGINPLRCPQVRVGGGTSSALERERPRSGTFHGVAPR